MSLLARRCARDGRVARAPRALQLPGAPRTNEGCLYASHAGVCRGASPPPGAGDQIRVGGTCRHPAHEQQARGALRLPLRPSTWRARWGAARIAQGPRARRSRRRHPRPPAATCLRRRATSRQRSGAAANSKGEVLGTWNAPQSSVPSSAQGSRLTTARDGGGGLRATSPPMTCIGDDELDQAERLLCQELTQYDLQLALRQQGCHTELLSAGAAGTPASGVTKSGATLPAWADQLKQHGAAPRAAGRGSSGGDDSIVAGIIMATGQGCRDVLAPDEATPVPRGACWTSHSHRSIVAESCCMLQLCRKRRWGGEAGGAPGVAGGTCSWTRKPPSPPLPTLTPCRPPAHKHTQRGRGGAHHVCRRRVRAARRAL